MKIGLVADTHDNLPAIHNAVARLREHGVGALLHAGDFVAPFALPPWRELSVPVVGVLGNNDGERVILARRFAEFGWELGAKFAFVEFDSVRVAMHHEPEPVEALAASGLYDLVVYGHTHELAVRQIGAVWVVNPGEVGGWLTGRATCVVFDTAARIAEVIELRDR